MQEIWSVMQKYTRIESSNNLIISGQATNVLFTVITSLTVYQYIIHHYTVNSLTRQPLSIQYETTQHVFYKFCCSALDAVYLRFQNLSLTVYFCSCSNLKCVPVVLLVLMFSSCFSRHCFHYLFTCSIQVGFSVQGVLSLFPCQYISFKKHFFLMSVENPRITSSNKVIFPLLCHCVVQTPVHTLSNSSTQRLRKTFHSNHQDCKLILPGTQARETTVPLLPCFFNTHFFPICTGFI